MRLPVEAEAEYRGFQVEQRPVFHKVSIAGRGRLSIGGEGSNEEGRSQKSETRMQKAEVEKGRGGGGRVME